MDTTYDTTMLTLDASWFCQCIAVCYLQIFEVLASASPVSQSRPDRKGHGFLSWYIFKFDGTFTKCRHQHSQEQAGDAAGNLPNFITPSFITQLDGAVKL